MKKFFSLHGKTLLLSGFLLSLLVVFVYVIMRSGPLAPTTVTLARVELREISPELFGIGIVAADSVHKIGPTAAGRIKDLAVQTGDTVTRGQVLGAMDPVDLDDKIDAQNATINRAQAAVLAVEANIREVAARKTFAKIQAERYEQLLTAQSVSKESVEIKRQDYQIAEASLASAVANLEVAHQDVRRLQAERDGLARQRDNLRLVAPIDGLITRRDADPGTTVVPGQTVIEVVEPGSIQINVRFDQQRAMGLKAGLRAHIVLRSLADTTLIGRVERIEPLADAVTEEILAKVRFELLPQPLPPIGELAEVTVYPELRKAMPAVRNACLQRVDGRLGVWVVTSGNHLIFTPVKTGATDLDGWVQILAGLDGGERVVAYSQKPLHPQSRIKIAAPKEGKDL
jgi:RND family efflux transporter MFP subunit